MFALVSKFLAVFEAENNDKSMRVFHKSSCSRMMQRVAAKVSLRSWSGANLSFKAELTNGRADTMIMLSECRASKSEANGVSSPSGSRTEGSDSSGSDGSCRPHSRAWRLSRVKVSEI